MASQKFNGLDEFEHFAKSTITSWSPAQRFVLTASMAERWLPVYKTWIKEHQWGKPSAFEHAVESVWKCVLGHKLTAKDRKLIEKQVVKYTPDPEDFDCDEAVATSAMIAWALNSCGKADNTHEALMALVCGFEAVAHNIYQNTHWNEIEGKLQKLLELSNEKMQSIRDRMEESLTDMEQTTQDDWHSFQVQDELKKQIKLLKLIGDMDQIDEQHVKVLRRQLVSRELAGTLAPRPEPVKGLTNEALFEKYRRRIEDEVKAPWHWEDKLQDLRFGAVNSVYFGEWLVRYSHRKDAIEKGPMLDVAGHDALLARNETHDAEVQGDPGWDEDIRLVIERCFQNPHVEFGIDSPYKPHPYGPSVRRFWIEAKQNGVTDPWRSVLQWARYQPPAWEEEAQRKKNRLGYPPELTERLARKLSWRATGDVDQPWTTKVAGETWRVGLNDFPDDYMYTLTINDAVIGKFHDWPEVWQR